MEFTGAYTETHNLGTFDIFVYLVGRIADVSGTYGYHQMDLCSGVYWTTDNENGISMYRSSIYWEEYRVLIWVLN